ncbi:MAG: hypothetical protein RLZZ587_609 [Actinomycetota bacterium]|jgi:LPXTG-motif cell wall-anchored protein
MKKSIIATVAAAALAAFTVAPANATSWDGDLVALNNFVWDFSFDGESSNLDEGEFVKTASDPLDADYEGVDGASYDAVYGDTLDSVYFSVWNDSGEGELFPNCASADKVTDTVTGDIIVTCTPDAGFDLSGDGSDMVDYVTEYRMFNEGDNGAQIRVSMILTNNDDHAIDFGWQLDVSFGECESGLTSTGDGDDTWELSDGWIDCASDGTWTDAGDIIGAEAPVTFAYGHADAADFVESSSLDDNTIPDDNSYLWSDEDADSDYSSIAVGETQIFSYFAATVRGPEAPAAYTTALEQQLATYSDCAYSDGLGSRLLAGLDATPENWVGGGPNCELAPAPELAETGVDATAGLGFGVLALAAGGALVVARRRRNA